MESRTQMIDGHYSAKYDVELTELGEQTLEMGRLIESQLKHATNALVRGDRMLAQLVADNEVLVNRLEVEIDRRSTEILARRQPAAGDLRFVLMVIKTVNDLERMGDEVTRVALHGKPGNLRIRQYSDLSGSGSALRPRAHTPQSDLGSFRDDG